MSVGIEAINVYGGPTFLDVRTLFEARGLDLERFENLMMYRKAVALVCEDPVTNGVNAALPIVNALDPKSRGDIEMVIACSESGLDFGKAMSTYMHDYLGLSRSCRLFELKQACYGGTAGLQMAVNTVLSGVAPGKKVLVIATDIARGLHQDDGLHYAEPSQGTGAVAMLVSDQPKIFEIDPGAYGCHSYEVMDTFRPRADLERGDPDLSLLSYLDCLEGAYRAYAAKVEGVDLRTTFDFLAFHTPFAGMVKGAHRKLMRSLRAKPAEIDEDFQARVAPSLAYCQQVGNVYSATVYFALCSLVDQANYQGQRRVGLFSYGSGCSSEFFSGLIGDGSKEALAAFDIPRQLASRVPLTMLEYERLQAMNAAVPFGEENWDVDLRGCEHLYERYFQGRGLLVLRGVRKFHREYGWS